MMKKTRSVMLLSWLVIGPLSASSVQIHNQGVPNGDLNKVKLHFRSGDMTNIFSLPSKGKTSSVKVGAKSYKRVYLSPPDFEIGDVTCQNVPGSFSQSKTYTVEVGYKNGNWSEPFCRFK